MALLLTYCLLGQNSLKSRLLSGDLSVCWSVILSVSREIFQNVSSPASLVGISRYLTQCSSVWCVEAVLAHSTCIYRPYDVSSDVMK